MLTKRDQMLAGSGRRRGRSPVALPFLCLALAALLALPSVAAAQVQTFKAVRVKHGVATFELRHVSASDVRAARVVGPRGTKRLSVRRVRRAVRRGYLRVRVARRGHHTRLSVRSKRVRDAGSRKRKSTTPTTSPTTSPTTTTSPTLVVVTPDPTSTGGTSSCVGQVFDLSSFGVGNWPPACWRPYADSSPFNQVIPADARIAANSATMVQKLLAAGPVNSGRAGIADTSTDFYKPIYFGHITDPEYTIHGGSATSPYNVDGQTVRMPSQARPAGGSDHHLTVVYNGYEYGFWGASVDNSAHTITIAAGRKIPMDGDGLHGGSTAARFGNLAGRIREPELEAGVIDHALFMASNSIATSSVYPADKSDGGKDPSQGYPPMGTRFQLAMSDAQIDALAVPDWKKAILRALAHYGGYLGDSTSSPWTVASFESGSTYTSFGYEDRMVSFARAQGLPSYYDSSIGRTVYSFDMQSGVDWARYLRVVDPCVAQHTC